MKRLSSDEIIRKSELAQNLQSALQALKEVIATGNEQIDQIHESMEVALDRVNELIAESNAITEDVAIAQENFSAAQEDDWHSSEEGLAYQAWMNNWQEGVEYVELALPEPIDDLDVDPVRVLLDLPECPTMPGRAR